MFKVMLIDDEPMIVEGMKRLVPWQSYDCCVIDCAYNGKEALRQIREQKPDIIFTDICMPEMDGLSMIAALKVEFPELLIAILTGYRDFDFAKEAVRLGVTRFLLKPSNMEELKEAVFCMSETLKKKQECVKEDPSEEAGSFIVNRALSYLEENYYKKITLAQVAENMLVSQWHLSKLLNRHTKKNFSELLNQIRINHAKELLKDPSKRIGQISKEVGFHDLTHFSKVFKRQEGISANEYRNSRL